jgi:cold shock CspA family protein
MGTLKFLRFNSGGYGSIKRDDGKGDDFLHVRDLMNSGINPENLVDGRTRLSYRLEQDIRNSKTKAVDLSILAA